MGRKEKNYEKLFWDIINNECNGQPENCKITKDIVISYSGFSIPVVDKFLRRYFEKTDEEVQYENRRKGRKNYYYVVKPELIEESFDEEPFEEEFVDSEDEFIDTEDIDEDYEIPEEDFEEEYDNENINIDIEEDFVDEEEHRNLTNEELDKLYREYVEKEHNKENEENFMVQEDLFIEELDELEKHKEQLLDEFLKEYEEWN